VTMELDINRPLAYLKSVGGKALKIKKGVHWRTHDRDGLEAGTAALYRSPPRPEGCPCTAEEGENQSGENCQWR